MKTVFILTSPRSYSSLISTMLGMHPECYPMPELNFFIYKKIGEFLDKSIVHESYQRHGTLRAVAQIFFGDQTEKSIQQANQFLVSHSNSPTQSFFNLLVSRINPKIPIVKAPIFSTKVSFLKNLPSDAHFIHLVRHPVDQYNSMLNLIKARYYNLLNEKPSNEKEILIKKIKELFQAHLKNGYQNWKKEQLNILSFLETKNSQNKYFLKSEDMITDKFSTLKKLCVYLKINSADANINQMVMPEYSPYAFVDQKQNLFGNDPKFLINPKVNLDGKFFSNNLNGIPDSLKDIAKSLGY